MTAQQRSIMTRDTTDIAAIAASPPYDPADVLRRIVAIDARPCRKRDGRPPFNNWKI